jgi:hypothetical protein
VDNILEKLTGVGLPIKFAGKDYTISPLTLADAAVLKGTIRQFIADEVQKTAKMLTGAGAPVEHVKLLWDEATRYMQVPLASPAMGEPEMIRAFLVLSLRRKHPDITEDTVNAMLSDNDVVGQMRKLTGALNDQEDVLGKLPGPTKKAKAAKTALSTTTPI